MDETVDLADLAPRIGALLMEKWLLEIRLQRLTAEKTTVPLDVKADEDLVAVLGFFDSCGKCLRREGQLSRRFLEMLLRRRTPLSGFGRFRDGLIQLFEAQAAPGSTQIVQNERIVSEIFVTGKRLELFERRLKIRGLGFQ